jgi:hypothetical protein
MIWSRPAGPESPNSILTRGLTYNLLASLIENTTPLFCSRIRPYRSVISDGLMDSMTDDLTVDCIRRPLVGGMLHLHDKLPCDLVIEKVCKR